MPHHTRSHSTVCTSLPDRLACLILRATGAEQRHPYRSSQSWQLLLPDQGGGVAGHRDAWLRCAQRGHVPPLAPLLPLRESIHRHRPRYCVGGDDRWRHQRAT